jgi:hypothetical protein
MTTITRCGKYGNLLRINANQVVKSTPYALIALVKFSTLANSTPISGAANASNLPLRLGDS